MLDLVLNNKEGLVGNLKIPCLGCRDREMVEFKILREVRRAQSKITSLGFRRADFHLFEDLLSRVHGFKPRREKGPTKAGQYSRITSCKLRSDTS